MSATSVLKSPPPPAPRHRAIDLIRALSVLWIVAFWHLLDYVPGLPSHKNAVTMRMTVVLLALFVLVSGYLMGRRAVPLTRAGLSAFYFGRFGRIYPPFVAALALFAALDVASDASLAKAAMLVAMLAGPPPWTLWFIAMICLFYAVTPLLVHYRGTGRQFLAVVVAVTVALAGLAMLGTGVDPRLAIYFPVFTAGIWLAGQPTLPLRLTVPAVMAAAVAVPLSALAPQALIDISLYSLPMALTVSVAVFILALRFENNLPNYSWIAALSAASYFMYLFHRPLYTVMMRFDTGGGLQSLVFLVLAGVPLLVVGSFYGQKLYDRVWTNLVARTAPRRVAVTLER